jgi:hypothetical protein
MRFALEQTFAGAVEDVLATFTDPDFLATLGELPKLDRPQLLEQTTEGDVIRQRVRYRFTGTLSPTVTRVLDPSRLVWVDETAYDTAANTATFRILPDHYANRLTCAGTYRFTEDGDGGTVRHTEGDLRVSYPIVGRAVERAIVSGLTDHLRDEGRLVDRWLAGTFGT